MIPSFAKTPAEVLDYGWDWARLLADGATIVSLVHTVPAGLTVGAQSFDDTTTTVWLSSGTAGQRYRIDTRVTDSDGRVHERSFLLRAVDAL
jgi:hypothetical protein